MTRAGWTSANSGPDYRAGDDEPVTITEFLNARLDEDGTAAKAAIEVGEKRYGELYPEQVGFDPGGIGVDDGWLTLDAQRMLREVAAKRAILAEHAPGYPTTYPKPSGQPTCGVCHAGGWDYEPAEWPCATVRAVIAVWSDHADYDETWRP